MKKFLIVLALVMLGSSVFADSFVLVEGMNKKNFWEKNGLREEKVIGIGEKILSANQINKRIPFRVISGQDVNAYSSTYTKTVNVYAGMLNYIRNDDEMAFILSHEIAHSVEAYGGAIKFVAMKCNSKKYEMKSDLKGIDYMVMAGYNPIAAITISNRIFQEPMWDWGFSSSHPKGSKRLIAMYKYIYKKYPQYLTSEMTKSTSYKNFEYAMTRDIKTFQQKEKNRQVKNGGEL